MRMTFLMVVTSMLLSTQLHAQDIAARADSVMRVTEAKGFSGVIRLAKNGAVVFEKGYGLANRAEKIPFTPATVVQIGSNTKDFTAVAILQLQDRGMLNVQDRLGKFFPSAPADKKDITIWQLMQHEAGFPLGLGGDFAPLKREQLVDSAMAFKLLFTPGARESYSNTGYALLAAIIEKVSGRTYDEYVRDNILAPLGLKRTGFLLPGFAARDLAHGYRANGEDAGTMLSKPHASDGPYWNLRGNGGMLSTVGDMHAFYRALFETDKLLKPETRKLKFNPAEPVGLAGSDLVNFFLYDRDPQRGVEMVIASTNANVKAPLVRGALASVMGLPDIGRPGGEGGEKGVDAPVARATGAPVAGPVAAILNEFVSTVNKGDKEALRKFIGEHFVPPADGPTDERRAERLSGLHSNLGTLNVVRMTAIEDGPIQVLVKTEREGEALLLFDMEAASPWRIKRFGIQVGG